MQPWMIVTGDFSRYGGMDGANLSLARYLAVRGAPVELVTHRASPEVAQLPNVKVHPVWRPLNSHLLGRPLLASAGASLARKLRPVGARVVVNGGNCDWSDINWVHYVHAAYEPCNGGGRAQHWKTWIAHRQAMKAERTILPHCRVAICNSERTRRDVIERLGVPGKRAHVVYYGCDPEQLAPITLSERAAARLELGVDDERPLVAFIGALGDRRKGFDTLFAAWVKLCRDSQWDSDLVVIGAGAELPLWQQRAREFGIVERIYFLGFRHDVPHLLAACNLLVHPARYEAYGLGVHEALCRGLPAIVTADAGVAERYSDDLRWLLLEDPEDAAELESRLRAWNADRQRAAEQVAALAGSLRSRTWDDMAAEIVQVAEFES